MHLLAISFSADEFTSKGEVSLIPMGFTVQAYEYLAQKPEFFTALGVSVLRTISGTALSLVVILMTAYPLSQDGRKIQGTDGFYLVLSHYDCSLAAGFLQRTFCTNSWGF